ncbi:MULTISPECIES: hypothetical protein [unclassified Bradyrhizobium]|uniref:hypothetical protein n=1 Tax=unclassified Bradyrhizobium TaxID=2631580 RepID=UPI00291668B7|nr:MULTISPECIES: hypothetical protein [unclassified Bradyrhizobium]
MARYAIVDTSTGNVINVVEYDADPGNPPPGFSDGVIAVQSDVADPTWHWDGAQLVPPAPPPPATWQLNQYVNGKSAAIAGYAVTIDGNEVTIPTSADILATINGMWLRLNRPNPPSSVTLQLDWTTVVTIPVDQFLDLASGIYDNSQAAIAKAKVAFAGITAGTITTYAQIDSIFAS